VDTKTKKRVRLTDSTLQKLGRMRGHYNQILREGGVLTQRKHPHSHVRGGLIDLDSVQSLEQDLGLEKDLEALYADTLDPIEPSMNALPVEEPFAVAQLEQAFERLELAKAEDDAALLECLGSEEVRRLQHIRSSTGPVLVSACYNRRELERMRSGEGFEEDEQLLEVNHDQAGTSGWDKEALMRIAGI
jgi:hypothetical protein